MTIVAAAAFIIVRNSAVKNRHEVAKVKDRIMRISLSEQEEQRKQLKIPK